VRSTPGVLAGSTAAFAVPIVGTFLLRPGIPGLPDGLWAFALLAGVLVGIRWRVVGACVAGVLTSGLIVLVHGPIAIQAVTGPPFLGLPVLAGTGGGGALIAGLGGAWLRARRLRRASLPTLTDALTGLPNRRHTELFLEHEFAVAQLGRPIAILLLDIDKFTAFAANHGEAAANSVLRSMGTVLRQNTRNANLSAHWEADRFVCLLAGARAEGAFQFARKLQEQIRQTNGLVNLPSVSIGIACYSSDLREPADLIRSADEAVRQAKRDGGDRIRVNGRTLEELERSASDHAGPRTPPAADAERRQSQGSLSRDPVTGSPRSAFVFAGDTVLRRRAAEQVERLGIRVVEGSRALEGMRPLNGEFDLLIVDLTREDRGVNDLVREVRRRFPATRVIGVPGVSGQSINAAALSVHVDGHLLRTNGTWQFQPPLDELLSERDRMRETTFRAMQLSDEVRVKEREARRAQQESEARLRSVVQSIREVLFRMDRSGAWISLTPAWQSITGFAVESCLGRPWTEFFHEDDRETLAREFDALTSIEKPALRREARVRTHSGATRWVEVRAQLAHDRFGNVMSASGTITDISERRRVEEALNQNEEYFRALIENSADIIAVVDADGRLRYASPAVERVLGLDPPEEGSVPALESFVHPDDLGTVQNAIRSVETPSATTTLELKVRHADGSWRSLTVSIRNLVHLPAVRGFVINAHDVSEGRAAERALRESEDALFRARKMDAIGMLAGGIAHDFNNVLTSIEGHADVALGALPEDHPIRPDLLRILEASTRAASLTRQLLAFGRRQVLRPKVIEVNAFVSDMHKMLVRLIGEHVQLRTELGATPDHVRADPLQIERALLNLAVNAREAMAHGGVLTIRTRHIAFDAHEASLRDMQPGPYVAIAVSDTGHGISRQILPHVFDPFFTTKPQTIGVGLGLSTVYGIVRQSGGHMTVESETGDERTAGSTFTIWLPSIRDAVEEEGVPGTTDSDAAAETIALVEDEPAVRELAARILKNRGYNVIPAEDGRQALDILARYPNRIDMLVTDVVMPGMSGRDLADHIGAMRPGLRILFMSGYSAEAVESHGILARGSTFLEKPFSPDVLLQKVRDVLDSPIESEIAA
jgi:diguanylate cyclase (GGDEF)-like protein/PAS domain S-box-containing protein